MFPPPGLIYKSDIINFYPVPKSNHFRDSILAAFETEIPSDPRLTAVVYFFLPPLRSRFINLGSDSSLGSQARGGAGSEPGDSLQA